MAEVDMKMPRGQVHDHDDQDQRDGEVGNDLADDDLAPAQRSDH